MSTKESTDIQFGRLEPLRFEELVADLLTELGFTVLPRSTINAGHEFVAKIKRADPFGVEQTDTWLVDVKFYAKERVSVATIHRFAGALKAPAGPSKGLIVTNGHMTSIAREFLDEIKKSGHDLRVIDRPELTRLVSQQPQLVERYFGAVMNEPER